MVGKYFLLCRNVRYGDRDKLVQEKEFGEVREKDLLEEIEYI